MAISERDRRNLYEQAEESMGKAAADTLMASLPPVGWADVATKADLDASRTILEEKLEKLEATLTAELNKGLKDQTWRLVTWVPVVFAVVLAIVMRVPGLGG